MKLGPEHSEKIAECGPSSAQIALGMPEIVATILHHYPRYGLRGQNNLATVSTVWHQVIKECHLQDEPTFEKLITDCLKCPEGVIHILRNDTLLPYLSERQVLRLISCHREFAIYLLENDVISVNSQNLLTLTKYHPQVAMHLLSNPQWLQRIRDYVCFFGCQHHEIAEYILDNNIRTGDDELDHRADLKRLADSSLIIARRLLNDPVIFEDLTEPNLKGPLVLYKHLELLIELSKTNESFAFLYSLNVEINTPEDFINHFETLCSFGLSEQEVKVLGDYHPEIAMKFLQNETLCQRFLGANAQFMINHWAKLHEAVAMHILKANNVNDVELADLCKRHPVAAKYVINTPHLCNRLCMSYYGNFFSTQNEELAIDILKTETFHPKLHGTALLYLASNDPKAAKMILTTNKFCRKLTEANVRYICNQHLHIVRKILNTQSLRELVEPADLAILKAMDRQIIIKPLLFGASKQAKGWDLKANKPSEGAKINVVTKCSC
ncbi:hypothetical protein [Candidatus Berkiella aquae]|uniref:Uncharacterized protein n=1 Tax=Candidatus Berkiella aquae TaxID=295108 RepID=A0A0Q9YWY9_9GAMM|nr:hypothetical protein [Candidatus Berkiella aquae]MCS5711110.1 hypothetical protein [Candidatus Berkiella aquae]